MRRLRNEGTCSHLSISTSTLILALWGLPPPPVPRIPQPAPSTARCPKTQPTRKPLEHDAVLSQSLNTRSQACRGSMSLCS